MFYTVGKFVDLDFLFPCGKVDKKDADIRGADTADAGSLAKVCGTYLIKLFGGLESYSGYRKIIDIGRETLFLKPSLPIHLGKLAADISLVFHADLHGKAYPV